MMVHFYCCTMVKMHFFKNKSPCCYGILFTIVTIRRHPIAVRQHLLNDK